MKLVNDFKMVQNKIVANINNLRLVWQGNIQNYVSNLFLQVNLFAKQSTYFFSFQKQSVCQNCSNFNRKYWYIGLYSRVADSKTQSIFLEDTLENLNGQSVMSPAHLYNTFITLGNIFFGFLLMDLFMGLLREA